MLLLLRFIEKYKTSNSSLDESGFVSHIAVTRLVRDAQNEEYERISELIARDAD
jgi:hypothetical protein